MAQILTDSTNFIRFQGTQSPLLNAKCLLKQASGLKTEPVDDETAFGRGWFFLFWAGVDCVGWGIAGDGKTERGEMRSFLAISRPYKIVEFQEKVKDKSKGIMGSGG